QDEIQIHYSSRKQDIALNMPIIFELINQRRVEKDQYDKIITNATKEFLLAVINRYEKVGKVELHLLQDDQREIMAVQLDLLHGSARYHYLHAYNSRYRRYSPGKMLLLHIIEKSFKSTLI